jgi:HSP20 family molecular chaperone IbpA
MPATDIVEEDNDLVVTIDLPSFAKKDTNPKSASIPIT